MDFSDVKGIVSGADVLLVLLHSVEVAHVIHAVVMIADGVINHHTLDLAGIIFQIFLEGIVVHEPIQVPGHVAERHRVHLPRGGGDGGVDVFHEIAELLLVVRAVRQMNIPQHEHTMILLSIDLFQLEINAFRNGRTGLEQRMEFGQNAVRDGFVPARGGDEDVAVVLLGLELIDALGVGLYDIDAVGDHYARQSLAFAGDFSVNGRTNRADETPNKCRNRIHGPNGWRWRRKSACRKRT